jgi:simple sugar transport system permease protein
LVRAAPLMLCGLCTALPARAGLIVIGNEGAMVMGAIGAVAAGLAVPNAPHLTSLLLMAVAGMLAGGLWICIAAALHQYRGVNAVISSLLLNYIAIALLNHLIEGPMRDPASLNNPSTMALADAQHLGMISGTTVHDGLLFGIVACLAAWFLLSRTTLALPRKWSAAISRCPVVRPWHWTRAAHAQLPGGACAGLAGMVEVAACRDAPTRP